jgi:mono/diheme cytochrome c family protein
MGQTKRGGRGQAITAVLLAALILSAFAALAVGPETSGESAYLRRCAGCHGQQGRGDGPDAKPADLRADGVLDSYGDEELAARLLEGRALRLEVRPDTLREHAADTEALYQYLKRLPGMRWEITESGEEIYFERCIACHGRYGHPPASLPSGVRQPRDLAKPEFQSSVTDAELAVLARHGKDHMPALIPRLNENAASQVSSYLRILSSGHELYERYCTGCHGPHGLAPTGLFGEPAATIPDLDAGYFSRTDAEDIRKAVWHMLRDARPVMPHFRGTLTADELRRILAYLRSLPSVRTVPTTQPIAQ